MQAIRTRRSVTANRAVHTLLCIALFHAASARRVHAQSGESLVITHATLIDGTGAQPRPGTTIIIRDGRIADIFLDGTKKLPAYRVVDLANRFVTPGFIDAHVHVATDPTGRDANASDQLRGALFGGVTSVRDMAGDAIVLRELAAIGESAGAESPRIFYSAVLAGPTFFQDPRTRSSAHGGTPGEVPWMRSITAASDIPAIVVAAKATGATGLKVYADLPADVIAKIVTEAHRQGLRVWSHATVYPARPGDVIDGGVDVISHALLLYWQGANVVPVRYNAREASSVYDSLSVTGSVMNALWQSMRARGTVLDATLFISARLESSPAGTAGIADPRKAIQWMYDATRAAKNAGVTIDAGTDGMMPGSTAELPNIHREMELLVSRAGFTPLEAMTAATRNSARAIGVDSVVGTVAVGKRADLVVLNADPATDIRNTRSVYFVMKGGRIFSRNPDVW
jgi:imidazolonepropionase-like amidohydrolase